MLKTLATLRHKQKRLSTRRRFLQGVALGTLGFCTSCAVDALGVEPEWVEIVEEDLLIKGLPKSFSGKRIVQISDLHCSRTVSTEYLRRCLQRVNQLDADLVVLTGDYITHDALGRFKERIIGLLDGIRGRWGVYAVMGNHDYGVMSSYGTARDDLVMSLKQGLESSGVQVLRNRAVPVTHQGERLWLVGLGDLWSADLNPQEAFVAVPADESRIVLVHNPDSIDHLRDYRTDAILCGHTHGGQVRIPFGGPPILPIRNRAYSAGMFTLGETRLYVNRGLGRLGRIRFNCRPEITVFTLRPA